jgi:hypothetical protein
MRGQMTKQQAAFLAALVSQTKVAHQDKWVQLSLQITPEMLGGPRTRPAALVSPASR